VQCVFGLMMMRHQTEKGSMTWTRWKGVPCLLHYLEGEEPNSATRRHVAGVSQDGAWWAFTDRYAT